MPPERGRALVDLVMAVVLLAFAVLTVVFVIPVEILEPRTSFGTAVGGVSPAAVPTLVCILIAIGAFLYLLRTVVTLQRPVNGDGSRERPSMAISWSVLAVVALTAVYLSTLSRLPFAYTTPVFLVLAYGALSERITRRLLMEIPVVALGSTALTQLIQLVFERGLRVYLGT